MKTIRHRKTGNTIRAVAALLLLLLAAGAVLFMFPRSASASPFVPIYDFCSCTICTCEETALQPTQPIVEQEHEDTRAPFYPEFAELERWILNDIWKKYFPEMLADITEQLTFMVMQQTMMTGALFDAKIQLETQQLLQDLSAQAHKDYRPSKGMCFFGTATKSLAAAQTRAETNAAVFNRWAQNRHLGSANTASAEGPQIDYAARLDQFRRRYCDTSDNNNGLELLCPGGSALPATRNKDIDYQRTVGRKLTLDIDLSDGVMTDDEVDMFALASNLYDSSTSLRIPESFFAAASLKEKILDVHAIAAKRSVAEASLFTIAGQKSLGSPAPPGLLPTCTPQPDVCTAQPPVCTPQPSVCQHVPPGNPNPPGCVPSGGGSQVCCTPQPPVCVAVPPLCVPQPPVCTGGSTSLNIPLIQPVGSSESTREYMSLLLQRLGIQPDEVTAMLGVRPSYDAQMEVLTKKVYQNPDFYTELYDSPVNVRRKGVAMQAIGLMQDFDTLNSYLRTEMMLSLVLELEIMKLQRNVQKNIMGLVSTAH